MIIPVSKGVHMLTHEQIVNAVSKTATKFPVKSVSYFGSYADGSVTEESDLDLLVEFGDDGSHTYHDFIHFKQDLEDELKIKVDVVEIPLREKTRIKIGKTVSVYGPPSAVLATLSLDRQIRQDERDQNLLLYIQDEGEFLLKTTERYDLQSFLSDKGTNRAISYCLLKIGNFVKSLSEELKQ